MMEWVSMKEQKPPDKSSVLVWDTAWQKQGWEPINLVYTDRFDFSGERYSHWMPLPEAPEKG